MARAKANGIELEYETHGDAADPAMLLIMGLGGQLTTWPTEFCELLAARGFHVIRFDNRDSGLSTTFDDEPAPPIAELFARTATAPYPLSAMSDDAAGLLDALDIEKAHIAGASMGGMIAQQLVIDHPERVLSLVSIMSTTGDPSVGQARPDIAAVLAAPMPAAPTREAAIAGAVAMQRFIGSTGASEETLRAAASASYDRSHQPAGLARQLAAIVTAPDRTAALASVRVPTTIVHGEADPLVNISGGRATAAAIPGATFVGIPDMGHDLPPHAYPTIIDAIATNAAPRP
ncbi:alpha/beta fold hydrolase [Fodinicola feengrottensis]|uniref:Alpha/beta hydrolase n=1 Tax=Fodinicola feengrottensis TaxID=435914 RepID=A0ABN2I776_9ACTN|nr:alpha/beta fold hydrolase [Fodinicola feengrottensis]